MTDQNTVIHCLGWVTKGGVERRRAILAEMLRGSTDQHVLICQVATSPLRDQLQNAGWVVHEIGLIRGVFDLGWYRRAYLIARPLKPTLIHGAVSEGNLLATFLGIVLRKTKVIIEETSDFRGRRATGTFLLWLMALRADAVVGVAPEISAILRERLVGLGHKVRTICNGVDPAPNVSLSTSDSLRTLCGIERGDLVLGSVGRLLDSHKRFSDVIRVLPRLSKRFPNLMLVIVGDGVDKDQLKQLALSLKVRDRVSFVGYQERPREFLMVMDVFVLASSGEALPLALIEAMHAGLPTVASRVGGNPFVLDEGRSGVLFSSGDLSDLEIKIAGLLESPQLRSELGHKAKKRAEQQFSSQRYVREVVELWDELAGSVR